MLLFSHSVLADFATPWTAACQASLSFTISQSLLTFMSIESVMPSNHLIMDIWGQIICWQGVKTGGGVCVCKRY